MGLSLGPFDEMLYCLAAFKTAPAYPPQGVMLLFISSAQQVDVQVARAQRRQLGLCEECGGVNEPGTCQQKGCPAKMSGGAKKEENS